MKITPVPARLRQYLRTFVRHPQRLLGSAVAHGTAAPGLAARGAPICSAEAASCCASARIEAGNASSRTSAEPSAEICNDI